MNDLVVNPLQAPAPRDRAEAAAQADQSRAVAEVQGAILLAKRFPRDQVKAMDNILQAFTRPGLAEAASYSYARGGTDITGPSIRTAETVAQLWGNIQFGIRELSQAHGESEVEAFAWDVETNTKQVKVFKVRHERHTRSGKTPLTDPRDIYEMVANNGARRLRACILGVIPGDVIDAAMNQAEATLKVKAEVTPDKLKSLLEKFGEFGVTQQQIETRIQRRLDAMTPALMVNLGKIYNSLKDGMSKASDWFEPEADAAAPKQSLKERVTGIPDKVPQAATQKGPSPEVHQTAQEPAGAARGTPVPETTSEPPKAAQEAAKAPAMAFSDLLGYAKKAKNAAQAATVRETAADAAYTDEERKQIEDVLGKKTFAPE